MLRYWITCGLVLSLAGCTAEDKKVARLLGELSKTNTELSHRLDIIEDSVIITQNNIVEIKNHTDLIHYKLQDSGIIIPKPSTMEWTVNVTEDLSSSLESSFQSINKYFDLSNTEVNSTLESINLSREQHTIIPSTIAIAQENLTQLEPREDWWEKLLKNLPMLGIIGGGAFILVYLGIGNVTRPLLRAFGRLFPSRETKSQVKLDYEMLHGETDATEAIAHKRASDPSYDSAWRKEAVKRKGVTNDNSNINEKGVD